MKMILKCLNGSHRVISALPIQVTNSWRKKTASTSGLIPWFILEDLRAMIMDYPDSIHVLGLILNADYVSPETWHMAVGTLLDFANDGKY